MQGIGMIAIEKLIILSIFVVILLISIYIIFGTRPTGDQLITQMTIRQCCTAYRASASTSSTPTYDPIYDQNVLCDDESIGSLAAKINLVQGSDYTLLNKFCNCCKTFTNGECVEWW
jgi:hypothetical protein